MTLLVTTPRRHPPNQRLAQWWCSGTLSLMVWAVSLYIPDLRAALPESADDVVPGIGGDGGSAADTIGGLIAWAVTLLAYALMVLAALGAAWFIFQAFGDAATRGNWGGFASISFGSLVMLSIVVVIGLLAVDWAEGLVA